MELMGSATHLRQGYGAAGKEGKVARVAMSKLGNERVSKGPRFALDSVARKRISSNCSGTPENDDG